MGYSIWLVVWNMAFILAYIGNVTIPTDFHIFQRGRYTTNQMGYNMGFESLWDEYRLHRGNRTERVQKLFSGPEIADFLVETPWLEGKLVKQLFQLNSEGMSYLNEKIKNIVGQPSSQTLCFDGVSMEFNAKKNVWGKKTVINLGYATLRIIEVSIVTG